MIARAFAPAFVLALPLLVQAQAPRARWSTAEYTGAEAPVVRVWIPGTWNFRYGQAVPVSFEVSEAAHVAVFRIDGNGHLMLLWPQRNNLQTAVRAGREYRITGPRSSYAAFSADYAFGQGMVIAIASSDPIDLSAFRRYRNDPAYYHYVSAQRPYHGGVKSILNRLTQEVLYAPDSPYDYDVAFYSVAGRSFYTNAAYTSCQYDYFGYPTSRYYRSYSAWHMGSPLGEWDDCYGSTFFSYCSTWSVFYGGFPAWCHRLGFPEQPSGPIAGGPQPGQPKPYVDMIDSIMARPVDKYPVNDGKTEQGAATGGTTHTVVMEPVREAPNGTRWLSDDENDAVSVPPRFRRENADQPRQGGRFTTRDEGFTRGPGTGIRVADPRAGDQPPERAPGSAFMPPVREPPRPVAIWRDNNNNDRGVTHSSPRWERPVSSEPRSPSVDRGSTSAGSGSSSSPAPAVMTPRTDASVSKTSETKTETKPPPERKP
ncbi:MAG: DUF4384 domain-containing protein [Gemmatimonadaceae bacterium]